jgi:uncharacterized protein YjbI with pentapeptide repeats
MPVKPKLNQEQYDFLMKCSEKKDITEWNDYVRGSGYTIYLCLEKANLTGAYLKGANLRGADLRKADLGGANLWGADLHEADLRGANLRANLREADLRGVNLREAEIKGANLREADLRKTNLQEINLEKAHLRGADLREADLRGADLGKADLGWANLREADLRGADLGKADLGWANLREADLQGADLGSAYLQEADLRGTNLGSTKLTLVNLRTAKLIGANLNESNITGTCLYGTSRDDWTIDGVKCDYIYWDKEGKERTPKDRIFRPGEFEALYKSLPEINYYFSDEFTPITPLIMDKVVNSINQKHPQFELKLDSFHSRGTPHAVFTVLHKKDSNKALNEITHEYKKTNQRLEGKIEILKEIVGEYINRPQLIQYAETIINTERIDHMGNKFGNISSGRDTNVATDKATINVINNDIKSLISELMKLNVPQTDINTLKEAIESDQKAPEHKDQSFGHHVKAWIDKAGSAAWRIAEGTATGILKNALKDYYGWS